MKKSLTLLIFVLSISSIALSQDNVAINNDGSTADPSAMLEIESTDKGLLIPRMTSFQRQSIVSPATGLLVFDINTGSFWYHQADWVEIKEIIDTDEQTLNMDGNTLSISNGNSVEITSSAVLSDNDNDTRIEVDNGLDNDEIVFYSDVSNPSFKFRGGRFEPVDQIKIGLDAGLNHLAGNNIFIGKNAGKLGSGGNQNTILGQGAGYNCSGIGNTIIGFDAGYNLDGGNGNILIGQSALRSSTGTSQTIAIGNEAGYWNLTGHHNVFIGDGAGFNNTGQYNVFLGNLAGYNETGDNKLYIDNNQTSTPLIYGDFLLDVLKINGTLNINDAYDLPVVAGTNGQVLMADGSGQVTWAEAGGVSPFGVGLEEVYSIDTAANFIIGSYQIDGDNAIASDNWRMFFNKGKGAFRAGYAGTDEWDEVNTGDYSFAGGLVNTASGYASSSFGGFNESTGGFSHSLGRWLKAESPNCVAVGIANIGGYDDSINPIYNPIFEVGIGNGDDDRKNGITITRQGKVFLGGHDSYNANLGEDYMVAIDGKLICEEVRVQDSGNWPDYVFTKEYELRSLKELELFIEKNGHLPEMPSAEEINGNGFETGVMIENLVEKVEELTLYIIEIEKKLEKLENETK